MVVVVARGAGLDLGGGGEVVAGGGWKTKGVLGQRQMDALGTWHLLLFSCYWLLTFWPLM